MTRLLLVIGFFTVACGSRTPAAGRIHEAADDTDLTDCTFLQKVEGTASESDPNAASHAKNDAKAKAAAIGATHVKWIIPCCTSVEAEAYHCDVPD